MLVKQCLLPPQARPPIKSPVALTAHQVQHVQPQDHLALSLQHHLKMQHRVFQAEPTEVEYLEVQEAWTYKAFYSVTGKLSCPVPECGGEVATSWGMQRHFCNRHPLDLVFLVKEGVYPRCEECLIQTNPSVLGGQHKLTASCRE